MVEKQHQFFDLVQRVSNHILVGSVLRQDVVEGGEFSLFFLEKQIKAQSSGIDLMSSYRCTEEETFASYI